MKLNLKLAAGAFCALAGGLAGGNVFAETTYDNTVFTDAGFFNCVKNAVSATGDSITQAQAESITQISCGSAYNIASFAGIDKLTNLTSFSIENIADAESVNLSSNSKLESVSIKNSPKINDIKLGTQTKLTTLRVQGTAIQGIDLTGLSVLTQLNLYNNKLASINLSKNIALESVSLAKNKLETVDLDTNTNLVNAYLYDNDITSLDVSKINTNITGLWLDDNVLVKTNFKAVQTREGSAYYAAPSTNGGTNGMFIRMSVASGLSTGKSKITTTGAKYTTDDNCAEGDAFCIIIDADILNYQNYVQLAYIGEDASAADIADGRDNSKRNYRLEINLEAWKEESDIKVPDTGIFSGESNGTIIAISAGAIATTVILIYALAYGSKRASNRGRFNR